MKFKDTSVMNFEGAFRGLRNPLESWSKSDSYFGIIFADNYDYFLNESVYDWIWNENEIRKKEGKEPIDWDSPGYDDVYEAYTVWLDSNGITWNEDYGILHLIGPNDFSLAQRMIKAGNSDRKFLRQIMVSVDITAPLYWFKEFDTYKIGTTANSTSTMHKLASTPITLDCFEMDDFNGGLDLWEGYSIFKTWNDIIEDCEILRQKYNETKDKRYWKELIRLLPESWLQTRTVTMNYENLRNMYSQRKNHRLSEWHTFCEWVETLPYAKEFILYNLD